jgi:hypothetical protein
MAVIESADYEQTRQRLMADPIVREMARGLRTVPLDNMVHDGDYDSPRHEFTLSALDTYNKRNPDRSQPLHIGAVAEVLLRFMRLRDNAVKAWRVAGEKAQEMMARYPDIKAVTPEEKDAFWNEYRPIAEAATNAREAYCNALGISEPEGEQDIWMAHSALGHDWDKRHD